MTKNQFIKIIHKYNGSTSNEASNVIALKETYPYSQVLHALSARLSKDHKLPSQQYELQIAAVYAADRAVLKEVMEKNDQAWPASNEVTGIKHPATPESIVTRIDHKDSADDLAEELMYDLHRLSELKDNFEKMFVDGKLNKAIPESNISRKAEPIIEPEPIIEEASKSDSDSDTKNAKPTPPRRKKSSGKTRAQRIVELAKKLEEEENEEQKETLENEGGTEDIIQQIRSSKKKIEPETEKQREQINLINQFIKSQPKITGLKDRDLTAQNDLSTINNGEFGDHVISETLVDILLKQGKKDKAIEVLKKLIWKFPQKKGYFAAQIEELKK